MRDRYLRSFVFRILIASSPNWIRCLSRFAFLCYFRIFWPVILHHLRVYPEYIVLVGSHPEHNKPPSALSVYLSIYLSVSLPLCRVFLPVCFKEFSNIIGIFLHSFFPRVLRRAACFGQILFPTL